MYSPRWSKRLRQGDVISELFLPTMGKNFGVMTMGTGLSTTVSGSPVRKVLIDAKKHPLMVISHCCEFNEGKRNKFLAARLQPVRGDWSQEQVDDLKESNNIKVPTEDGREIAGVDSFYLDPIEGLLPKAQTAMFISITPLPMDMKDEVFEKKIAELDHDTRLLLREKLAWFFGGRTKEDILDEDKIDAPTRSELLAREGGGEGGEDGPAEAVSDRT